MPSKPPRAKSANPPWTRLLPPWLIVIYVGMLPLLTILRYGVVAPINLFASDAFYYLDLARNSIGHHGFTFDGQYPTNGFHPLWEWLLVGLGRLGVVRYGDTFSPLIPVMIVCIVLLAAGSGLFCSVALRYLRRPLLGLLILAPGPLWIVGCLASPRYIATWTGVNGMESGLAFFCFSVALFLLRESATSSRRVLGVSVVLGLFTLARLDDGLLAAVLVGWMVARAPAREGLRRGVLAVTPLVLMVGAYLIANKISVGVFLPVSGAVKASLGLLSNLHRTASLFLPVVTGNLPVALRHGSGFAFDETAGRLLQMWLPLLIGAGHLAVSVRRRSAGWSSLTLLDALAAGVVLKAVYNLTFVRLFEQGFWYYTVPIAVSGLLAVVWLDRALSATNFSFEATATRRWSFLGAHLLWVLLSFNAFLAPYNTAQTAWKLNLLQHPGPARERLAQLGATRFIEYDDGFLSYALQTPALAGMGLAIDPAAAKAARQGRLLPELYGRGYRVAIAAESYSEAIGGANEAIAGGHPQPLWIVKSTEWERYRLIPIAGDRTMAGDGMEDGLVFYSLVPAPPTASTP